MLSENILELTGHYRSWIVNTKKYDHLHVCLQLGFLDQPKNYPFKFNYNWLEDGDFVPMVRNYWCSGVKEEVVSAMDKLIDKLIKLKKNSDQMGEGKETDIQQELLLIKEKIDNIFCNNLGVSFSLEDIVNLEKLEANKTQILSIEEAS